MLFDRDHDHLYKDLYLRDEAPPHPGEILRDDMLPALELSKTALARVLGITPRKLGLLLAEKAPVTLDLALRLGVALGHGPRYWLGLQMQHDLWRMDQPHELKVKRVAWAKATKSAKGTKSAGVSAGTKASPRSVGATGRVSSYR